MAHQPTEAMAANLRTLFRLLAGHGLQRVLAALLLSARNACLQRRLHISSSEPETITWHVVWQWPTRALLETGLREHLGIARPDFRHRAENTDSIDTLPPAVPANSSVLLAGSQALAHPSVQAFLGRKATAGVLHIVHPGDAIGPRAGTMVLLYGIAVDAAGQALLLELRRRGIACNWLAAAGTGTPAVEIPLREACERQAIPADDGIGLIYADIAIPPEPVFHRYALPAGRRPLRVLTYRWHVPHQYELFKLGAEFTLVTGLGENSCRWWDLGQRPLPANARFARWSEIDPRQFDLAILHFDENVLQAAADAKGIGAEWGRSFRFLQQHLALPRIALCHGTPQQDDEAQRIALVEFLGDTPVVVNSHQALAEWRFRNAQVIWQGFDPAEFPCRPPPGTRPQRILTLPGEATTERPGYRGADLLTRVAARVAVPLEPLRVTEPNLLLQGNAYSRAKFSHYISALHGFNIFFNPTLRSPMPRTRGEAMLCGLTTVNADSHDVGRFIENGRNGFYAASVEELADQLRFLLADPERAWRIGQAGRETAMRLFHIDRYLADWRRLIGEILGQDAA
jgi:hypothetical protein